MPGICATIHLLTLFSLTGITQSVSGELNVSNQTLTSKNTFNLNSNKFQVGDVYTPNPHVLFQLAKKDILEFSYPLMDSIYRFLTIHDSLLVEIGVHTDQRQCDYCCTDLSQSRAKSISQHLISKGISPERLIAKGYGKSKPLITQQEIDRLQSKEEKERAYQQNRRVEITILRMDYAERNMQRLTCDSTTLARGKQLNKQEFDQPAEFPGGQSKLYEYMGKNLKIEHIDGYNYSTYYVQFIVDSNGQTRDHCIIKPTNPYPSGESILSVFREMPQWKPATKDGKPVASSFFFPVRICLGRGVKQIEQQE
ncbi:MAG: hypothetical protein CL840_21325 [Crocinitomicaceae bacterium]|nr:hypothetical protein [Crocinitomicaceae bacterium]|tara:strand:- start:30312 stop:31241 length:930 start_codon:yes stop_codon:yes gene_type:complete